ncbi:MAG: hypothetical protein ACOYN0_07710 [Phycisphaerales bacterium]
MRNLNRRTTAAMLAVSAGMALCGQVNAQTVFYAEGFDTAVINQLSGDPRVVSACGAFGPRFTHNPPAGWTWDGCGVPSYSCRVGTCPPSEATCGTCGNDQGVREWEGWSFVNKAWWVQVAGDQGRSQFALGTGNVAVADPDEWDDRGNPDQLCGKYNAWMGTPAIDISNVDLSTLSLNLSSSWDWEGFDDLLDNNQTAIIRAYYTVGGVEGAPVEVLRWDSDPSGSFFHATNYSEAVSLGSGVLNAPVGATAVRFEFGLVLAANDWWWAVDNITVNGDVSGTPTQLFFEGFEGVTLEEPVHELPTGCGINYCGEFTYTHTGPNGVNVTVASPASGGVPDWRGWSFVRRPFWQCASGGPNGNAFTNSSGILAVAEGDEFDDLAHDPGKLNTTMTTPAIDISGRNGDLLVLSFDSSWRWESGQTVTLVARYNTGEVIEVLRWESDTFSQFFKPDAVNERVVLPLVVFNNLASSVTLEFNYDAGNNWWWAVDNISVFEGQAEINLASVTPVQSVMTLAPSIDYAACFTPWSPDVPAGWTEDFVTIGACPAECGRAEWRGWSFAFQSWWSTQVDTQNRELFTRSSGVVAIADPDEWDDQGNGNSNYNAFMSTPSITLPNSISSASLNLDSSWRPEGFDDGCSCPSGPNTNNQTAKITAYYTVGGNEQPGVDVLHWDSDGAGAFFHPDNENEAVALDNTALAIPSGAQSVRFEFSLTNARNDWWWAIDNVNFNVNGGSLFSENFENVPNLQQAPTENPPVAECLYFSTVSAQGGSFTVDNAGLTGCSTPDFTGFNAWYVTAWARVLGGERLNFGADTAFVSDHDAGNCNGTARFISPSYGIGSLLPNTLELAFRSSWGSNVGHASSVEVKFDNGAWTPVLSWNTGNKTTTADENIVLAINNPDSANTVQFRFNDAESGWWAITEINITGQVGTPACIGDYDGNGGVDGDDVIAFFGDWDNGLEAADVDGQNGVDGDDVILFFARWDAGC